MKKQHLWKILAIVSLLLAGCVLATQSKESVAVEDSSSNAPVEQADNVDLVDNPQTTTDVVQLAEDDAEPAPADVALVVPATNVSIYSERLEAGWQNWSWNTTLDDTDAPVQAGSVALSVTFTEAWAGLSLQSETAYSTLAYDAVRFWIHGGTTGGHQLSLKLRDSSASIVEQPVAVTTSANSWTLVEVTMSDLGLSNGAVSGIVLQDASGGVQPAYYLDDVQLVAADGSAPPPEASAGPGLNVDITAVSHEINPDIYGINFWDHESGSDLVPPVVRWGGNHTTRYNWKNDVSNRGSDWFFMNVPDGDGDLTTTMVDEFVMANNLAGSKSIITMPMIGWTPAQRLTDDRDCGFPRVLFPHQEAFEEYWDCGNGRLPDGTLITGNDPSLTGMIIDETWIAEWITHLNSEFGTALNSGVTYYALDNEPMLWNSTHRDVHPNGVTYDELRDTSIQYAEAIKATDPTAQTLGPVLWGWTAYFYSAADVASGAEFWNNPPDRLAHGDVPLVAWYLQQMAAYEQTNGTRLLDYLDLHFYPQQSGVALAPAGSDATQELRLRSTRALWDETYVDESWIAEPVRLIPRMHDWVQNNYPDTKIAITEYNWGGLEHINGALAQADILGIFGRERVDLATLWAPPASGDPGAFAFRMYLNYDGNSAAFGNQSLTASSANSDELSIFAARRSSDNALTIMVINKSGQPLTSTVSLSGFGDGTAQVYRYAGSDLTQITQEANQLITAGSFAATFPADSITLFEVVDGELGSTYLPQINN